MGMVELLESRRLLTPVIVNVEPVAYADPVNSPAHPVSSTLVLTDARSTMLTGASVQLDANFLASEDLLSYPAKIGNISGSFDASSGKLTLTGADTVEDYQAALRSVTYQNTNSNPNTAVRRFQFSATDAIDQSGPAYRYFNITSMISNLPATPTSYSEGDPATPIASQLILAPTASGTIASASIRIDANYVNGEDVLAFSSLTRSARSNTIIVTSKISGAWNPATGTLTLTAASGQTPMLADFQAALRSVTYTNTSQNPSTQVRRFAIWTNNGDSPTLDGYSYLNVIAVNTPPTITSPSSLSTVEETPLAVSGIAFADPDAGAGLETVTFSVLHGVLSFGKTTPIRLPQNVILGSNTNTLTLSALIQDINLLASSLNYYPIPFYSGPDTLTIQINDNGNTGIGGPLTATANVTITVIPLNHPPTIVSPASVSAAENTSVVISGVSFSDSDAGTASETVTLTETQGILSINTNVKGGLIASQITGNGTNSVTLTAPLAAINATLADSAGMSYFPNLNYDGSDTLRISINDNGNSGAGGPMTATAQTSINIAHVNQRPVVSNLESVAYAYTEKDHATPISNQVTVTDVDHTTFASGTVSVDANYTPGEDVLNFVPNAGTGNIAVLSNAAGVLSLVSAGATATTANWQAAFRAVTYKNTSANPNTAVRRFLFQVNDGTLYSLQQYRWFTVTAVNDPPAITAPQSASVATNTSLAIGGISFSDPDAGSASETLTLFCLNGTLTFNTNVTGGLTAGEITGNGTGKVSITAPLSAFNATLASSNGLIYQSKLNYHGTDVINLNLSDNGNTGSGGPLGASAAIRLTVTP